MKCVFKKKRGKPKKFIRRIENQQTPKTCHDGIWQTSTILVII